MTKKYYIVVEEKQTKKQVERGTEKGYLAANAELMTTKLRFGSGYKIKIVGVRR